MNKHTNPFPEEAEEEFGQQYKHVRAIERGLAILDAVARNTNSSAAQISAYSGVPRTTVYRILETLENLGYVRRNDEGRIFYLTSKIRMLASNVDSASQLGEIAFPIMEELVQDVLWPSSLTIIDHDAMRIVETTHHLSPYSVHRNAVGTRIPLLTTALGRAYLCFCGEAERLALLENVRGLYDVPTMSRHLERLLHLQQTTRKNGYASSNGETDPRFASFALPIRKSGNVIASMNMIFFRKTMKLEAALEQYLPALNNVVDKIEKEIAGRPVEFENHVPRKQSSRARSAGNLPEIRDRAETTLPTEH
ncbi:MAG: helix-turn-helix domain-containing protein [Marinosulfonomonas sp.]|nr:helix-turn-helix domain-containing protein [Marinosulfonomonas sp.]